MHGGGLHVAIVQSPPDVGGLLQRVLLDAVTSARAIREAYMAFAADFPGRYELMFGKLSDRKSATRRKHLVAQVTEMTEKAGGLAALHGEASLRLAGLEV